MFEMHLLCTMKKIAILALVMGATFSTFAIVAKRPPNATPLSGDWEVVQMPYQVKTSRPQLNFNGGNKIVFLSAGCQKIVFKILTMPIRPQQNFQHVVH
jgi:hypothetical protein